MLVETLSETIELTLHCCHTCRNRSLLSHEGIDNCVDARQHVNTLDRKSGHDIIDGDIELKTVKKVICWRNREQLDAERTGSRKGAV